MAPRQIPVVKSIIRSTQIADAERLLAQALTMSTETEIEELVYGAMNRALPARAHRRRRGPAGGVSARAAGRGARRRAPRTGSAVAVVAARGRRAARASWRRRTSEPATRTELEWRRLLGDSTALALVAVDEARARRRRSGSWSLRLYDTPADPTMVPRRRGHVETLVVSARQRRRGVGRRLMAAAADWARGRGAAEMVLTTWVGNGEADAFYERLGYRVLSRVLQRAALTLAPAAGGRRRAAAARRAQRR